MLDQKDWKSQSYSDVYIYQKNLIASSWNNFLLHQVLLEIYKEIQQLLRFCSSLSLEYNFYFCRFKIFTKIWLQKYGYKFMATKSFNQSSFLNDHQSLEYRT